MAFIFLLFSLCVCVSFAQSSMAQPIYPYIIKLLWHSYVIIVREEKKTRWYESSDRPPFVHQRSHASISSGIEFLWIGFVCGIVHVNLMKLNIVMITNGMHFGLSSDYSCPVPISKWANRTNLFRLTVIIFLFGVVFMWRTIFAFNIFSYSHILTIWSPSTIAAVICRFRLFRPLWLCHTVRSLWADFHTVSRSLSLCHRS